MRKRQLLLMLAGLLLFAAAGQVKAQDEMFKALFLYNFTKDVEWPADYKQGNFVIAVLGASAIVPELEKIAQTKKVGSQSIQVLKVNSPAEAGRCHLMYVPSGKSGQLAQAVAAVAKKPVLVVSDKPGGAKEGACINFVKVDGKQKFEINTATINAQGLKVTSFLASLGISVQ